MSRLEFGVDCHQSTKEILMCLVIFRFVNIMDLIKAALNVCRMRHRELEKIGMTRLNEEKDPRNS